MYKGGGNVRLGISDLVYWVEAGDEIRVTAVGWDY